jgi:hypothetical protein
MSKWKNTWNKFVDIFDDFLAYILTIIGILYSTYQPMLKTTGHITFDIDWQRVVVAAVGALLVIGKQEQLSPDDKGDKTKSREGRKGRFTIRMINALGQGVLWSTMSNQ